MSHVKAFKKSWRDYRNRGRIGRQIRVSLYKQGLVKRNMRNILYYPTPISSSIHVPAI